MPTLADLKKIATRLKIKGRSKMRKAELEQAIANHHLRIRSRKSRKSRKSRTKKSRKSRVKKSRKPRVKKSVKKSENVNVSSCDNYENTEPLSWESLVEDVPKKYIISFDFNVGGNKVTMCYNIAYLRNYLSSLPKIPVEEKRERMENLIRERQTGKITEDEYNKRLRVIKQLGVPVVPLLRGTFDRETVKLTQAQRDKAKKKWNGIMKADKAGFKRYLTEQDPKWGDELTWDKKVYKNPYVKLVSQATPTPNFNAVHIITPKKLADLKRKYRHVENTIHMNPRIYNDVKKAAKWTVEFPSGREVAANTVWFDNNNMRNIVASDQDASQVLDSLVKLFDRDKLVQRKSIDGKHKWVLALPLETEPDFNIAGSRSRNKKFLISGGNMVDNKRWTNLLRDYEMRGDDSFYKLWVALASALNTLVYH